MLLTDMMEWTHWATRMHPALHAGDTVNSPYTADQRSKIAKINANVSLNTLSRIWQVMVAAVPEMQAAGNQKQCFDMLIVRLMHIADIPSVPDILKRQPTNTAHSSTTAPQPAQPQTVQITTADALATQLKASKEILLYSYYTDNIEVLKYQTVI